MISDRMDINRVLLEMRSLKAQTQTVAPENMDTGMVKGPQTLESSEKVPNFSQLLDQAVNKVNDVQKASNQLATDYEQGQSGVDITDVMIASQKASVTFQAMLQVRNKLVDAYRDIMNMPV